jgi:hypothetical protein
MDAPGWIALDDISVEPMVPEPAPVLLFGSGLLLALFMVVYRKSLANR